MGIMSLLIRECHMSSCAWIFESSKIGHIASPTAYLTVLLVPFDQLSSPDLISSIVMIRVRVLMLGQL